jgi:hypothetical protein
LFGFPAIDRIVPISETDPTGPVAAGVTEKGSLFDKINHMSKRQAAKVNSIEREVERMKKSSSEADAKPKQIEEIPSLLSEFSLRT